MNHPTDTSTSVPDAAVPAPRYAIKCQPEGRYAVFQPLQQLLVLVDSAAQSRLTLGFASGRLLELLLLKADAIVTREEIFAYAWPGRVVSQNSLNQAVSNLRELLGDEQQRQVIQTIPRRGYQFNSQFLLDPQELPVQSASVEEPLVEPESPAVIAEKRLPSRRPLVINALLVLLSLFLLGGLIWRVDVGLLLQPGLVVSSQQQGNQHLLYTAANATKLAALETDVAALRERLLKLADQPGALLFNRMHDFYDVICIDRNGTVESLLIYTDQLAKVGDQQLLGCLK